ncbi:MAG: H-NS histone family protein [Burkholderiales bacterium]|nr:H-NS histone family protein [Burkholderiales bacterium]MDE2394972.1 H-NS histone family protein [Burkholderiales bacterium]MDE2452120.1 H-NS histone family protein [Burkholderiales bacterium]
MSKTYTEILQQIESLQAEAEQLRQQEKADIVGRIRVAIEHYGLTATDLGLDGRARPAAVSKAAVFAPRAAAAGVKYTDGAGHSWGGRGPRPRWLRSALAAGARLEDYLVG